MNCLPIILLSGNPNRSALELVYIVGCPMPIMLEIMFYYARNLSYYADIMRYAFQPLLYLKYAGIIYSSLFRWHLLNNYKVIDGCLAIVSYLLLSYVAI